MSRRVRRLSGRIKEVSASCEEEGCHFFALEGDPVGTMARDHTHETGHATFMRIERMIFYERFAQETQGHSR